MTAITNPDIVFHFHDQVFFRLECSKQISNEIYNNTKYLMENFQHTPNFRYNGWDGYVGLYNSQDKLYPIGLYRQLREWIESNDLTYTFSFDTKIFRSKYSEQDIDVMIEKYLANYEHDIRYYQKKAFAQCINNQRGVILLPTGAGKSLLAYLLIRFAIDNGKRVLLMVPNQSLVNQMYNDFKNDYMYEDCDKNIDRLYGGLDPDIEKPCLISTWQSLVYSDGKKVYGVELIKDEYRYELLKSYDIVIGDETHGNKSKQRKSVLEGCRNAQYRIGMTGTLSEDLYSNKVIESVLGRVLYEVKTKELQDLGILADVNIKNCIIKYPEDFNTKAVVDYHSEVEFINNINERNYVLKYILDRTPKDENIMILVKRIDRLKNIEEFLNKNSCSDGRDINIIYGEVKAGEREEIRNEIIKGKGKILLTTYATCGTGINIPSLRHIVFFENIKSKISVLQSLGRGTRKTSDKDSFVLWDVIDNFKFEKQEWDVNKHQYVSKKVENYSCRHFRERKKYYTEQGFTFENVDYELVTVK